MTNRETKRKEGRVNVKREGSQTGMIERKKEGRMREGGKYNQADNTHNSITTKIDAPQTERRKKTKELGQWLLNFPKPRGNAGQSLVK